MKKYIRLLPLPAKLAFIAFVPLIYTFFLTIQLIREKTDNIHLFQSYQEQTGNASHTIQLIENLQEEWKTSYSYALGKGPTASLKEQRVQTDKTFHLLDQFSSSRLNRFASFTFLNDLPYTRLRIDSGLISPSEVTTYYISAIFRLSSLNNVSVPANHHLEHIKSELKEQEDLSQMITYLVIMRSTIYNALYSHKDQTATLYNLKGMYEVFESYQKELFSIGSAQTINDYNALRFHPPFQATVQYVDLLLTKFSFDSSFTAEPWWNTSGKALDELTALHSKIGNSMARELNNFYQIEHSAQKRTIILLVLSLLVMAVIIIYTFYVITEMLTELKYAAKKISHGITGIPLRDYPRDVIGSLATSIARMDQTNQKLALQAAAIGKGDFNPHFVPRSSEDLLGNALVKMKEDLQKLTQKEKQRQQIITQAVLAAQEKERTLLGAELHDNINQLLTSVKLYIEFMQTEKNKREDLLAKSGQIVSTAIQEIRKLSRKLVLPSMEAFPLRQALEDLATDLLASSDIPYQLNVDGLEQDFLSEEFKIVLYRIIQEQLTNIVKYAEASFVSISIKKEGEVIELVVSDNGKGFDPSSRNKGIGLSNISNRTQVFNGRTQIHSAPGSGCELKVAFPFKEIHRKGKKQLTENR